jgi:hypothetical protein
MEINMTQMRKFEQEAIATEIYEKILVKQGLEQIELSKTKEYKAIKSLIDKMSAIEKKRNDLYKELSSIKDTLQENISAFNDTILDKNFTLTSQGRYYDSASDLRWTDNEWKLKQAIERKLAIALISPDWKDKLSTIIDDIASEFGA